MNQEEQNIRSVTVYQDSDEEDDAKNQMTVETRSKKPTAGKNTESDFDSKEKSTESEIPSAEQLQLETPDGQGNIGENCDDPKKERSESKSVPKNNAELNTRHRIPLGIHKKQIRKEEEEESSNYKEWNTIFMLVFVVFISIVAISILKNKFLFDAAEPAKSTRSWDEIRNKIRQSFFEKNRFPSQNISLWTSVIGGLKILSTDRKPAVFLLVHNDDVETSSCIAEAILRTSNRLIFPETNIKDWTLLNGSFLAQARTRDHGVLIKALVPHLHKHKSLIITNLEDVPGHLAVAFHSLTDEFNPAVGNTLFVFILNVGNRKIEESNADNVVTRILETQWHDLSEDYRAPLIIRISSSVLPIVKEQLSSTCVLNKGNVEIVNIP